MIKMSEKFDILYDIDMQLYNEFNDKLCEINEHLGDIYSCKDKADVEDAEKSKERQLLREAVKNLQKELEQERDKNKRIKEEYIPKSKVREKIEYYKWAIESYDCDTADYGQSQAIGAYVALIELLNE